jgi:predicted 3-demethylubiquinone-9 3-methyltransferase (glyoxalase superfamily)
VQKITPFLWFDNQAEEAMNFYTSIFKNAKIGNVSRYGEGGPGPKGSVMVASFEFTEAISFYVSCASQDEVDHYWDKLSEGGQTQRCGWLKDKFGVSWQIIPSALPKLMGDPDRAKANRVMQAMLQMKKIEVAKLQQAYDG